MEAPGAVVEDLQEPAADPAPAPAHDADSTRPRAPRGWDRSDPDEDFTDLLPAEPEPAPPPPAPEVDQVPDVLLAKIGRRAPRNQKRVALAQQADKFHLLSERDRAVAELYVAGKSRPEIAAELGIELYDVGNALTRARRCVAGGIEQRITGRKRTISLPRLTREERKIGEDLEAPDDIEMPRTRGECQEDPGRPCPWVRCKHHNYLDVDPRTGAITLNFPHLEVWEIPESCSLDVADRDGVTLEEVGAAMNLTRERIRQIENKALERGKRRLPADLEALDDVPRESPLASVMAE